MWGLFFQQIKTNPVTAATVGGCLSSTIATIPLYILHYEHILFDDMNDYAAQAAIGVIGFGIFILGAVASALAQQYYKRHTEQQDNSENSLIINSTFRL